MSCIFCNSLYHLSEYCDIFVYIDHDLLPRFIKMSDYHPLDQLILSFYLPKNAQLLQLKPIKVRYLENLDNTYRGYKDAKIFIAKEVRLNFIHLIQLFNYLTNLYFIAESVVLYGSKISSWRLLQLLSSSTKMLKCVDVEITTKLNFTEIVKRIPNVEEIYFNNINVEIGNYWVEQMMDYKLGRNFKKMSLKLDAKNCNFNVEILAEFMKVKCVQDVHIRLHVDEEDITHVFNDQLMKHFVVSHHAPHKLPLLFLQIKKGVMTKNECYTLKNI